MITAEIILDTRYKSNKGYPLKIRVYDGKKHRYINLKSYQIGRVLDRTSQVKRKEAEIDEIIEYVNKNKLSIDSAINLIRAGRIDRETEIIMLQRRLSELRSRSGIGLIEFLDLRISEKIKLGHSIKNYQSIKSAVESFLGLEKDVALNEINYEWLSKFIIEKKASGVGNGVSAYLRGIRAVYKEAQKRESLGIKKDNPFLGLIITGNKKDVISIEPVNLKKLIDYKPPKSTTEKNENIIRRNLDLFLFQFAIGGHDFADVANLKWNNIKNGRIKFKRFKNRNKPSGGAQIDNILNSFALNVIEKYGRKNTERVFSFIPDPNHENDYFDFRNIVYRSLKRVSENMKIERIGTKTPRYLFRTYAGNLLIDSLVIMQLQGHSPQGVSFGYQKSLPYEIIDREHKKVLDLIFDEK